jgi:uracil-DNA glycosylase
VLKLQDGITRLRGKNYTYRTPYKNKEYPVAVIYHPSYLLRAPVHKRVTWQDLLAIKSLIGGTLPPDLLRKSSPAGSSQ